MKQIAQVVMLPTEKAKEHKQIIKFKGDSRNNTPNKLDSLSIQGEAFTGSASAIWEPQHLYLVDNSEIKEGDWKLVNISIDSTKEEWIISNKSGFKGKQLKIIATTDKSLCYTEERTERGKFENLSREQGLDKANFKPSGIALIPESFITAFVKSNGTITEVLVEWEEVVKMRNEIECEFESTGYISWVKVNRATYDLRKQQGIIKKLKLREDNTVIISPSKTYTREEVIEIVSKLYNKTGLTQEFHKWIEQNL